MSYRLTCMWRSRGVGVGPSNLSPASHQKQSLAFYGVTLGLLCFGPEVTPVTSLARSIHTARATCNESNPSGTKDEENERGLEFIALSLALCWEKKGGGGGGGREGEGEGDGEERKLWVAGERPHLRNKASEGEDERPCLGREKADHMGGKIFG